MAYLSILTMMKYHDIIPATPQWGADLWLTTNPTCEE